MRGLTEITREGEVPVCGVECASRSPPRVEVIPKTIPATYMSHMYMHLGMIWEVLIDGGRSSDESSDEISGSVRRFELTHLPGDLQAGMMRAHCK